jgi:regulator of replication initiation timing
MENQKNNSSLKAVIAVLAILLVGSLVYIFKISSEVESVHTEMTKVGTEKESVMKDLQDLKATYDAAIAENTSMSEELIQERDKVVKLMDDLKKSSGDLSKYRSQVQTLQGHMKELMTENEGLKKQNTSLTISRDSTVVVLGQAQKFNEVLVGQNEDLSKTVEKGSKLSVLNLQTAAYKLKSSGKEIATDKASRANVLKISFTIAENSIAKSGDKDYYVQVIDSKNNVLGDAKSITFGDKELTYSFVSSVKYENKTVQVSQDLAGKDFVKGMYTVNVFDKDQLVSSTNFSLR